MLQIIPRATSWIFFYLLLDELYQDFITRLDLIIGLSIVWRWSKYLNLVRFGKITYLLWDKRWTLIRRQSLGNTESINNIFCNKLNYLPVCHILQRNHFGPLSKVNRSNQHEAMPLWRRGLIWPIKSNPQPLNGHGLIIECNNVAGTNWISPNLWHSSHPL